jgi:predicted Zn-dependent peptidase
MSQVIPITVVEKISKGVVAVALSRGFLRSTSIALLIGKGSYADPLPGCACLCSRMKLRLTSRLPSLELQKEFDKLGVTIDSTTDRDSMLLRAQAPSKKTESCLNFLAELLNSPCFADSEVDKEKTVQKLEYDKIRQDPMTASVADSWEATFPDNSLGKPVTGYPETIDKLNSSMLEEFDAHARQYAPLIIGIVGPQDEKTLIDYAKSSFGSIETAGHGEEIKLGSRRIFNVFRRDLDAKQTTYSVGIVTGGVASAEYPTLLMIEDYLGSRRHYIGVLWNELREKRGLTYFVESQLNAFRDQGVLMAFADAEPDKVLDGVRLMLDSIARLRDTPVADEELDDLKVFHRQVMDVTLEVPSQAATWVVQNVLRGGKVDFDSYLAGFDAVSPDTIRKVAEGFLKPSSVAMSVAGRPPTEESLKTVLEDRIQ